MQMRDADPRPVEHPFGQPVLAIVNGEPRHAEVDARKLLVHFLRDDLGVTSTHVGCDTSQCGACTVHLDGRAVKSCTILAVQADGAAVDTVEALSLVIFKMLVGLSIALFSRSSHTVRTMFLVKSSFAQPMRIESGSAQQLCRTSWCPPT